MEKNFALPKMLQYASKCANTRGKNSSGIVYAGGMLRGACLVAALTAIAGPILWRPTTSTATTKRPGHYSSTIAAGGMGARRRIDRTELAPRVRAIAFTVRVLVRKRGILRVHLRYLRDDSGICARRMLTPIDSPARASRSSRVGTFR